MNPDTPVRTGIVGAGRIVKSVHLPVLLSMPDSFEVVGIADVDPQKATDMADDFAIPGHYSSLSDMIDDNPDLELVTIATKPFTTHAPLAIEALRAGCHVNLEKPFTVSLADAREMFRVAEQENRTLCAYQNRRFEVAFLAFEQAIRENVLGELRLLRRRTTTSRTPSDLLDFGSHVIDQMICLTEGQPPQEINATIQHPEVDYDGPAGFFKLSMRYPEGLLAEVEILPNPKQVNYFYAAGTEGSYYQDWADSMADLFRKQMALDCEDTWWLPDEFEDLYPEIFRYDGSLYYTCYKRLYEHLRKGSAPPVTPSETLLQYAIIEAMFRSAREQRTVTLPDFE